MSRREERCADCRDEHDAACAAKDYDVARLWKGIGQAHDVGVDPDALAADRLKDWRRQ